MNVNLLYTEIMQEIAPFLTLSGALAFTIAMIVMLVNMIVGAATGKGFNIGLK